MPVHLHPKTIDKVDADKRHHPGIDKRGNCGWGCGSGPNAVANEKAVMDQYGWHTVAWVLYPSFAVIIDDIYNPIFLSIFSSLITK